MRSRGTPRTPAPGITCTDRLPHGTRAIGGTMAQTSSQDRRRETELVSFRLDRELIARIDERARALDGTRTDGTRDLIERGLTTLDGTQPNEAPTPRPAIVKPRARRTKTTVAAECGWGGRPPNAHY